MNARQRRQARRHPRHVTVTDPLKAEAWARKPAAEILADMNALLEMERPSRALPDAVVLGLQAAAALGVDITDAPPDSVCRLTPVGWNFDRLEYRSDFL